MDQTCQVMRDHHYAYRSEQTYYDWIMRDIQFHASKANSETGKIHIDTYLSHLVTHYKVSAFTQQQALNAIVFLYRRVLDQPIEDQLEPVKAKRQIHLPMPHTIFLRFRFFIRYPFLTMPLPT